MRRHMRFGIGSALRFGHRDELVGDRSGEPPWIEGREWSRKRGRPSSDAEQPSKADLEIELGEIERGRVDPEPGQDAVGLAAVMGLVVENVIERGREPPRCSARAPRPADR